MSGKKKKKKKIRDKKMKNCWLEEEMEMEGEEEPGLRKK